MDPRVEKIKQLLLDDVQRKWSLRELARRFNLSVWLLSHIFESEVGKSPMQYLRQLRMDRAKYLLETSFSSVKEITHEVGLEDESRFVRDFKKAYGEAPTRYRLRARSRTLDVLTNEFDEMLEEMQTQKSLKGMKAAFNASPVELGRSAIKGARGNSQAKAILIRRSAGKAQAKAGPAPRNAK